MKTFTKILGSAALSLAMFAGLSVQPADAQLVLVETKYRIVDVDRAEERIAIALPDAEPDVRQNWVYIDNETRGSMRTYYGDGYFKDNQLSPQQILNQAEAHEGDFMRVHGGRDWDGSIDAKTIWF